MATKLEAVCTLLRHAASEIILVGKRSHDEIAGTMGEVPERTHVVSSIDDVERLDGRKIGHRPGRHAHAVAHDQDAPERRLVKEHRQVDEVAHVPHRGNRRS